MHKAVLEITDDKGIAERIYLRSELAAFVLEMQEVLRENDHKSGWDEMSVHALFGRIKQEFEEMFEQYILYCNSLDGRKSIRVQDMRKEAIDVSNFCMFLCHNYSKDGEWCK